MSKSNMPEYKGARTVEQREIYRHGRLAGQRGQPPYDNPYAKGEKAHELWLEGWREGWYGAGPGIGKRQIIRECLL